MRWGSPIVYWYWARRKSPGSGSRTVAPTKGCRILREVWRDEGTVPDEVETYEEDPRARQRFRVTCRPADANVAPDCAVMWTVEGRVRQRRCGPIDQSSIEDWL